MFTVPLKWLAKPFNLTSQRHNSPDYNVQCDTPMFHPFTGNVIWGMTEKLILQLLHTVGIK